MNKREINALAAAIIDQNYRTPDAERTHTSALALARLMFPGATDVLMQSPDGTEADDEFEPGGVWYPGAGVYFWVLFDGAPQPEDIAVEIALSRQSRSGVIVLDTTTSGANTELFGHASHDVAACFEALASWLELFRLVLDARELSAHEAQERRSRRRARKLPTLPRAVTP